MESHDRSIPDGLKLTVFNACSACPVVCPAWVIDFGISRIHFDISRTHFDISRMNFDISRILRHFSVFWQIFRLYKGISDILDDVFFKHRVGIALQKAIRHSTDSFDISRMFCPVDNFKIFWKSHTTFHGYPYDISRITIRHFTDLIHFYLIVFFIFFPLTHTP